MNARVERSIGFLVLGAAAFVVLMLVVSGSKGLSTVDDSVDSSEPNGRRALWLTLSELGFDPIRWSDSPNHLPHSHDLLWLSRVPTDLMPGENTSGKGPKRIGLHALDHYREFVEGGGTLMLRASDLARKFLADDLGFEACRSVRLNVGHSGECTVRTGDDEDLHIGLNGAVFAPLDPGSPARELWSASCAGTTEPFVVVVPEGAGSVVLLSQDDWVRNDSIGEHDNAIAAVRLVEQVQSDGRLLMDAYETGSWSAPSLLGLLFSARFALATLNIIACLALFVWIQAFARAFPRDREALELFSSLVRARALGGVLARAHRYPALATLMRRGMFARLARRVPGYRFVPTPTTDSGIRLTDAASFHVPPAPTDAAPVPAVPDGLRRVSAEEVAAFAKAAGMLGRRHELEAAFVTIPVRSRHDLDALDRELDRIRREIEDHLGARMSGGETSEDPKEPAMSGTGDRKGTG